MLLFGNRSNETEVTVEAYAGHVEDSFAGLQTIVAEAAKNSYEIRAGLYLADIIAEEKVLTEGANPEVLVEAVVKDALQKIKEMFQKFWAKVKAWFAKVKQNLQAMFTSGEKFVKKFKEQIRSKATKGFSYTGYKYTLGAGATHVAGVIANVTKKLNEAVDFDLSDSQKTADGQLNSIKNGPHQGTGSSTEEKEKFLSSLGAEDLSDLTEKALQSFRNGQDSTEEFEEFSGGNSKEELIGIVEKSKDMLRDVDKAQKTTDTAFARVLSSIKSAQSKIEAIKTDSEGGAKEKDRFRAFATHKYEIANYALGIITKMNGVHVSAIKEATRHAESTLKAFLRHKPAKESFGYDNTPESGDEGSILENAIKFFI